MMRSMVFALILFAPFLAPQSQQKCSDIVGTWKWFVGPQLSINADHSFSNGENSGNWELISATERKYTLRWDVGGFVDQVTLSADGKTLTGTNSSQNKVSGERVGECTK